MRRYLLQLAIVAVVLLQSLECLGAEPPKLEPVNVSVSIETSNNNHVARVVRNASVNGFDEATFARLDNVNFKDGTIRVKVLSRLLEDAPNHARGFIGIAFRINKDVTRFECIYIRPTNARSDDQVRRNHSIQYFAYPEFKFDRLRKESPEKYESYADMGLDEWIDLEIRVKGSSAKLYLNNSKEPVLIVNDLKLGAASSGSIGLFVDIGTEGFFKDIQVMND